MKIEPVEARRFGEINIAINDIAVVTTSKRDVTRGRVIGFSDETLTLDTSQVFKAEIVEVYFKDIQSIQ